MLNFKTTALRLFILLNLSLFILACDSDISKVDEQQQEEEFLNASNFTLEMDEITKPITSTKIGNIEASTNVQQEIEFRLMDSNPNGALQIDSKSGEINISEISLFDYELFPVITAEIEVSVGDLIKNIEVVITLKDKKESNSFIYKNEIYTINKIREFANTLRNDGKRRFDIRLTSPGIELYNISGMRGQGAYVGFSFYAGDFDRDIEINEGEFNLDTTHNDVDDDFVFLETDYIFTSQWQNDITKKNISEARVIYKRTDFGSQPIPQRKEFTFNIKFILQLTDGSIVSGSFEGNGNSGYY